MTNEQLDAIDLIISEPGVIVRPTYCAQPHPEVDLFNEELRSDGFVSYAHLNPFRLRRKRERSLWVRRSDDRCVPELYALAVLRYYGVVRTRAFWTDGDPEHNAMDNVSLATIAAIAAPGKYSTITKSPSRWNDPVGRLAHRQIAKQSAQRKRVATQVAKQALQQTDGGELLDQLRKDILLPDQRKIDDDDRDVSLEEQLHQIVLQKQVDDIDDDEEEE